MATAPLPAVTSAPGGLLDRARGQIARMGGFADQPALRRAMPALTMLAAAGVSLALWLLLAPAERVTLQTGMPEAEKARAMEVLTAGGFDARLDPGTGALTVGAADYHAARMALATEGLPQGTPDGMASIENMPMGTSRSVETARLRRMQELDLARTIAELQPLRAARVHLALPERSAFVRDRQPPTASVVVQLAPGMDLTAAQVRAIVSLVAAAVPDMARDGVSVVDQSGRLLSNDASGEFDDETNTQMRHRTSMEDLYRDRILALVTPIVGAQNVAVEVTVDMDFTRSEVMREQFDPGAVAVRSEQLSIQDRAGREATGIPGAVSNAPPPEGELTDQPAGTVAAGTTDRNESSTRNFEISRQVETIAPQSAVVTRVSAAVLVRSPDPAPGADAAAPAIPDAVLEQIAALTRSAVGFVETRGDSVIVQASPFVAAEPLIEMPWYDAGWLPGVGRVLAQLAVLAIVILGVVRPLLSRLLPPAPDPRAPAATAFTAAVGAGATGMVEVPQGETLGALRARLEGTTPAPGDVDGRITYEEKVAMLQHLAQSDTARIAAAFQAMMTSDTVR